MPVIPSEVGGVEPGGLALEGGGGKRLRELCEVLLTARAKMLGFSQQMAHELSSIPPNLRSSIVNGLGEIVAHLDQFEIQLGDTRLTGKVRLGADAGMGSHFPGTGDRGSGTGVRQDRPMGGRSGAGHHLPLGHVPLSGSRAAMSQAAEGHRLSSSSPGTLEDARASDAPVPARKRRHRPRSEEETERSASVKDGLDDGPQAGLWRIARARHRKGLSRHALDRLEHSMLCWVCLALLQEAPPERPEASYERREEALHSLALMGYARRAGKGWRPTPAGFEASGLVGYEGQLEIDP